MGSPASLPFPQEIADLSAPQLDRLIGVLEASVPQHPTWVRLPSDAGREALVFGDSHGDWRSTEEIARRFLAGPGAPMLLGLGDYIDRAPDDCPGGSAANALFLLGLAGAFPERVLLIQGNHERARTLGVSPHTLPRELAEHWGSDAGRTERILRLLERGPLLATTQSGVYLAHAGFPRGLPTVLSERALSDQDVRLVEELTWPEADASAARRGAALPWGRKDLDRFLDANGLSVFLRGHDPDLTGRSLYGDRCLTLHSCRLYARFGGVLVAAVPLHGTVRSARDIRVSHLSIEGTDRPR